MREWIGAPEGWGSFRLRANDWFHDLVTVANKTVADVAAMAIAVANRRVDFTTTNGDANAYTIIAVVSGTNRIREMYHTQPDGLGAVETIIDGARVEINSPRSHNFYRADGGTSVMQIDRENRRVIIPAVENVNLTGVGANWNPYGGAYGTAVTARKGADGFVTIDGLWRTAGATASGWIISTLPVGFRPLHQHAFIVPSSHSSGFSRIDVLSNGQIQIMGPNQLAANGFISNSGITFYAGF